ncbi:MAG: YjdF family protein [Flavonifractor plautii]
MECGYARLTVWFADPFWVGVYEREAEGRLEVCRHTFGAEPKDGEVWQWLLSAWRGLDFSPAVEAPRRPSGRENPKRTRRQARNRPEKTGAGTKSQQALQLQREARRVERAQRHRQRDAAEEERRFRLRQEKRRRSAGALTPGASYILRPHKPGPGAYPVPEVMGLVGIVALEERRGRRPVVTEERVLGLRCLRVSVPVRPGLREDRRKRRAEQGAAALYRAGVRRALTAEDFPDWPALEGQGLRSVDPEPFCQAIAVPLALAALRRAGILRVRATVALSGPRVSRPLFAAAARLCPQVRHLVVDVPGEGEELAAWLREEYGAAVLRPGGAAPDVTLAFGPGGEERGTVLRLYGPAPGLAGLRPILEEGGLPPDLAPLPLLSLLWECGRLTEGQIRIHAT